MRNFKELSEKTLKKAVNTMMDADFYGWPPPGCVGVLYQPKKPEAVAKPEFNEGEE